MRTDLPNDVTSLQMHLNELKSGLDLDIRRGAGMEEIRNKHTLIKEVQCHLTALQWTPLRAMEQMRGTDEIRQRSSNE